MTDNNQEINLKNEKSLNIFWLSVVIILIAISAPWFNHSVSGHELIKSYFSYFGISVLAVISIYFKTNFKDLSIKFNGLKLSLLVLFSFGTLSIFWSNNIDLSINKWLLWLTAFLSFLVANNLSINHRNLLKFSWGLMLGAGFIAAIGVLQHLFDPFSLTEYALPASTFGNRNLATQPLILIVPFFLFIGLSKNTQGAKFWLLVVLASLIFAYLFYSTSRGAWLSVFVESILIIGYFIHYKLKKFSWIVWNKNKRNASIFGLIFTISLCSLTSDGLINPFEVTSQETSSIISSASTLGSSEAISESNVESWRIEIWKTAFKMFQDSPIIGSGLGTYSQNLASEGYATWLINNTFRVHNDLLELLVEIGTVGMFIFIVCTVMIILSVVNILKNTNEDLNFFFFILIIALIGSFVNLQFSFPYQMPVPIFIFGLYCGLISKKFDEFNPPLKKFTLNVSRFSKKILTIIFGVSLFTIFFFTYFQWIKVYHQLNKDNLEGDFSKINIVETSIYNSRAQGMLYRLGGNYFDKGRYHQSNAIDEQFLKFWPNHLDVLFRHAYAMHKLGQNDSALKLSSKLEKLEPSGLYNSFIVKMFVYSSSNKTTQFEEIFNELLAQPEEFLKLNDDTYRFLVFFSLGSKILLKNTEYLYQKYVQYHGYHCEVTNNIAIYYFNLEDYDNSAKYVNLAINKEPKKNPKCLNPTLVKLLDERKLLESHNFKKS